MAGDCVTVARSTGGAVADDVAGSAHDPHQRSVGWWPHACGIAWLVVAAIAVLTPALSHGTSLGPYDWLARYGLSKQPGVMINDIHGDQITQMIPWTQLAWTQVHSGHLPLWNSYSALGMPLAFNWQSAVFSLPALVGYLVPLRLAFTAQVFVTLVVAGSGAYVLAWIMKMDVLACTLAGTVFELSGAFMFWLGWPIGSVLSWSGWLFAAVLLILREGHRARDITVFAIALAFAVYAGQPDALTLLILSVVVFAITLLILRTRLAGGSGPIRRPLTDLVVGGVAGLALAAPLALPGYQVAGAGIRTFEGSTFGRQAAWTYQDLSHLLFEGLNGLPPSFSPIYLGAIVVVLAVAGAWLKKRDSPVIALIVVAVFMGLIAFVQPVENGLHQIPGLQAVRWYRSVVLVTLSLSVLAGLGIDLLVRSYRSRSVLRWVGGGLVVAAGALVVLWAVGYRRLSPTGAWARSLGFRWSAVEVAVGLIGIGVLAYATRRSQPGDIRTGRIARVVAIALLVCSTAFLVASGEPLWHSTSSYKVTTPAETALQQAVGSSLVGLGSKHCFLPPGLGIRPNANVLLEIRELAVYDPMLPRAYFQSWAATTGESVNAAGFPYLSIYCPGITTAAIARVYGVGYVLVSDRNRGPKGSVFDRHIGNERLYRIPDVGDATLTPVLAGGRPPGLTATGKVLPVTHPGPASWKLSTDAAGTQVLRLHLTDTPGWHATIDGRPLALTTFASVMLQATIPAGHHVIELHYWPATFSAGILLAVLAAIGLVVGLVYEGVRRRRESHPAGQP